MDRAKERGRPIAAGDLHVDMTNRETIRKAHGHSVPQKRHTAKRQRFNPFPFVAAAVLLIIIAATACATSRSEVAAPPADPAELATVTTPARVEISTPAPAETLEPVKAARFDLTPEERDLVERVVMAEAGGETYAGQMAVAQCILDACEKTGKQPSEAVEVYQYTTPAKEATSSVRDAVAAVFDEGYTVSPEPILFFYAPRWTSSAWHESQIFVMELGGHRFFAEKGATP